MKRITLCRALIAAAFVVWSGTALCGGQVAGTVKNLIVFDYTYAFFTLSAPLNGAAGPPACNTSQQFAINLSAPGGRAILTTLLHAQTMGYAASVTGAGVCDIIGDRESVDHVWMVYP